MRPSTVGLFSCNEVCSANGTKGCCPNGIGAFHFSGIVKCFVTHSAFLQHTFFYFIFDFLIFVMFWDFGQPKTSVSPKKILYPEKKHSVSRKSFLYPKKVFCISKKCIPKKDFCIPKKIFVSQKKRHLRGTLHPKKAFCTQKSGTRAVLAATSLPTSGRTKHLSSEEMMTLALTSHHPSVGLGSTMHLLFALWDEIFPTTHPLGIFGSVWRRTSSFSFDCSTHATSADMSTSTTGDSLLFDYLFFFVGERRGQSVKVQKKALALPSHARMNNAALRRFTCQGASPAKRKSRSTL